MADGGSTASCGAPREQLDPGTLDRLRRALDRYAGQHLELDRREAARLLARQPRCLRHPTVTKAPAWPGGPVICPVCARSG